MSSREHRKRKDWVPGPADAEPPTPEAANLPSQVALGPLTTDWVGRTGGDGIKVRQVQDEKQVKRETRGWLSEEAKPSPRPGTRHAGGARPPLSAYAVVALQVRRMRDALTWTHLCCREALVPCALVSLLPFSMPRFTAPCHGDDKSYVGGFPGGRDRRR